MKGVSLTTWIKLFWVKFVLAIGNGALQVIGRILFRKYSTPERILIFRTGSIGDNICSFPAIVAVRRNFPKANIDILTIAGKNNPASIQYLLSASMYDEIIDYSNHKLVHLLRLLRSKKYNLVIELPQDQVGYLTAIRNMFFFRMSGIPSGFGWEINTCFQFRQTQEKFSSFQSERDRLLSILERNKIKSYGIQFPLKMRADDDAFVSDMLIEKRVPLSSRMIALVPGAKRPQNRYPMERFVQLRNWLVERGFWVIIVGGPEDVERGEVLSDHPSVTSFCGEMTPIQSAVLLSKCSLTISNDTGPMHLSYAVGTPVIGLFSSRDFPNKWFPPTNNLALRNNEVHCSLCFSETCANNICMQGITLDEVKNAFLKFEGRL